MTRRLFAQVLVLLILLVVLTVGAVRLTATAQCVTEPGTPAGLGDGGGWRPGTPASKTCQSTLDKLLGNPP